MSSILRKIAPVSSLIFIVMFSGCAHMVRGRAERCEITALDHKQAGKYLPSPAQLPKGARRLYDLEFTRTPQGPVLLDLYLPAKTDKPLPLIVWIHGGSWLSEPGYRKRLIPYHEVARGYALASITYRSSTVAKFPAQIEDCKAAIRWLRAHAKEYGINPNRIGVWGGSAGAHLAALLATSSGAENLEGSGGNPGVSTRVQAACDFAGPTDFYQRKANLPTSKTLNSFLGFIAARLVGGNLLQHKDLVEMANPINFITRDTPPFLIMHGDRDNLIPLNQSEALYDALKAKGVEVKFCLVKGRGHERFVGPEIDKTVDAFFDKHLKGGHGVR